MSNVTADVQASYSTLLYPLCKWTTSSTLCLGTVIPIAFIMIALIGLLVYGFYVTPNRTVLEEVRHPSQSPLLPDSFKMLDSQSLSNLLCGVNDVPLKTFLPGIGLEELVETAAMTGVASIRDMLRINRLALRDIGMGPKEQRLFSRALERRVKLRETLRNALFEQANVSKKSRGASSLAELQKQSRQRSRVSSKMEKETSSPRATSSPSSPPRRKSMKKDAKNL